MRDSRDDRKSVPGRNSFWFHVRFTMVCRDVEGRLADRGVDVSYETVRLWGLKFGPAYARQIRERRETALDAWHLEEVFVTNAGKLMYLWRAVDGEVLEVLVQKRRNKWAALRIIRKLLKSQGIRPTQIVTDKLKSYGAAPG